MTTYIWKVSDWKPAHDQLNHNGGQYNITLKHRKLSFNHTGNKKTYEFKKLSKGDKNHDKIAAECCIHLLIHLITFAMLLILLVVTNQCFVYKQFKVLYL